MRLAAISRMASSESAWSTLDCRRVIAAYTLACAVRELADSCSSFCLRCDKNAVMNGNSSRRLTVLLTQIVLEQRHELPAVDRLGDVVVASTLEAGFHVFLFATSGNQDDGSVAQ